MYRRRLSKVFVLQLLAKAWEVEKRQLVLPLATGINRLNTILILSGEASIRRIRCDTPDRKERLA
jgi:hypothetical protein